MTKTIVELLPHFLGGLLIGAMLYRGFKLTKNPTVSNETQAIIAVANLVSGAILIAGGSICAFLYFKL